MPTLRVLDEFRERFGSPVQLLSTYHSPGHNRAAAGESKSFHMQFRAIDFACGKGTPDRWADLLRRMRNTEGVFHGGIGVYPGEGFVHVDTRGYDANWRG